MIKEDNVSSLLNYVAESIWQDDSGMCFIEDLDDLEDLGFTAADLDRLAEECEKYDLYDLLEVDPDASEGEPIVTGYSDLREAVLDIQGRERPGVTFDRADFVLFNNVSAMEADEDQDELRNKEFNAIDSIVVDLLDDFNPPAFIVETRYADEGHREAEPKYILFAAGGAESDANTLEAVFNMADFKNGVDFGTDPLGEHLVAVSYGQNYTMRGSNTLYTVEQYFVFHQLDGMGAWTVSDENMDPAYYVEHPGALKDDFYNPKKLQSSAPIIEEIKKAIEKAAPSLIGPMAQQAKEAAEHQERPGTEEPDKDIER